jgi:DNA-binding transcriptional MerR regulator
MFKIGDFSKLTRVSAKMLRHYDELGLLKPAHIDPTNGYRYYSASQLPRLNRLIALKDLGFSLEQIGALLDDALPPEELQGMLKLRQAEIEAQLRAEQQRLERVAGRLRYIEQEKAQPRYEIVLREVRPQLMACLRQVVPDTGDPVAALFDELEAHAAVHQARAFSSPLMIIHDPDYREMDVEVEVAVPLTHDIPGTERIRVGVLPGSPNMACVVYTGAYDKTEEALSALTVWIDAHGYRVDGPFREVYLRFNADMAEQLGLPGAFLTDNSKAFVTEIQIPVTREENDE